MNQTGLYSALNQSVIHARGAPRAAAAGVWSQWLDGAQRRGEFRAAERDWLGLDAWLSAREGIIQREALQLFIKSNQVQMEIVLKGTPSPSDVILPEGWTLAQGTLANNPTLMWQLRNTEGDLTCVRANLADLVRYAELPLATNLKGEGAFGQYTLPGGDLYRELLVTLPRPDVESQVQISESVLAQHRGEWDALQRRRKASFGQPEYSSLLSQEAKLHAQLRQLTIEEMGGLHTPFESAHFEETNVVVHLRLNERKDVDGKRTLVIEECQSDWAQAGRAHGYRSSQDTLPFRVLSGDDGSVLFGPYASRIEADIQASAARTDGQSAFVDPASNLALERGPAFGRVPDAPFKLTKEWTTLAFKQALRVAVQTGCDQIAWTSGQVQADRYDMSSLVSGITWVKQRDTGLFDIVADRIGRGEPTRKVGLTDEALAGVVGKELARKILDGVGRFENDRAAEFVDRGYLSQTDLKLGGEGLKAFYDQLLPSAVGRYIKPMGGIVDSTSIRVPFGPASPALVQLQAVSITPAMRESVIAGQPMFRRPELAADTMGMTVDAVASIAREFLAAYKGGLSNLAVRIGQSLDDLYGPGATEALGATASGAYHPARGILAVAANRMRDRACVEATLRHELLGHYGLNTFMPEDKRAILDTILASRSAPGMSSIWSAVDRRYADKDQDTRAEEVFALIAEQPRGPGAQLWDSLLALINKGLRAAHLVRGETSRPELQVLAQSIAQGLRDGRRQQLNYPATDDALFRRPAAPAQSVGFLMARNAGERVRHLVGVTGADPLFEDEGAQLRP